MGETRTNTWKYQAFKSMPHYESLHVFEASTETVLSLSPYGCYKKITADRFLWSLILTNLMSIWRAILF